MGKKILLLILGIALVSLSFVASENFFIFPNSLADASSNVAMQFNFTNSSTCAANSTIFSVSQVVSFDARGISSVNINIPSSLSQIPTYLCEYRDAGTLVSASPMASLFFNHIYASQINATGNITATTYYGDGSHLTGILTGNPFDQSLNTTDNVTFANITASTGFFSYLGSLVNKIITLFVDTINATTVNAVTIGNSSTIYYGNGSQLTGITATASPAGNNQAVQYNDNGATGGNESAFWFDKSSSSVGINGSLVINGVNWSQSHGAIIASGNNSNGYYVQYADGTMIEWGTFGAISHTSSSGSMFYGTGSLVVFPQSFTSTPVITTMPVYDNYALINIEPISPSSTGFQPIAWGSSSGTTTSSNGWYAIGRWTNLSLGAGSGGNGGIVNTITNSNGTCTQWANGVMECYVSNYSLGTLPVTSLSGSLYYSATLPTWTYPSSFTTIPSVTTYLTTTGGAICYPTNNFIGSGLGVAGLTSTNIGVTCSAGVTLPFTANLIAVGRWTNSTSVNTPDYSTWGLSSDGSQIVQVNSSKDVNITGNLTVAGSLTSNMTKVRVVTNTAETFPSTGFVIVTYDNKTFDTLNEFDTTTHKFTAKYSGYYQVSAAALMNSQSYTAGTVVHGEIYINGAASDYLCRHQVEATNTEYIMCSGTTMVYLNAGDTLDYEIYSYLQSSTLYTGFDNYNYLTINRIA